MTPEELQRLVEHLRSSPRETEWVEFKHNNADPREIGEDISALSNGAALHRQPRAFALWGIEDGSHNLLGTNFQPRQAKVGNEEIENWLLHQLTPRIDFRFHEGDVAGKHVVLLEIPPASHQPVGFSGTEYIRVGSYKKKLKDHPEKERALWAIFSEIPFESGIAAPDVTSDQVFSLIDCTACFRLLGTPLPDNRRAILDRLAAEKVIVPKPGDHFDITNVGAILFAADLRGFDRLARKAPRVVIYKGDSKIQTIKEHPDPASDAPRPGYATGFEPLLAWINDQLPQNEEIGQALRRKVLLYPEVAIRELVANALIHQDFNITGTGPMIEIFTGRMEITNLGLPLIDPLRFIDNPPQSRNETLAGFMRRMNFCEERGSGIDKVIRQVELFQLPAPDFRATTNHTVAILLGPRKLSQMDRQDRIRACYQHACLWYVAGKRITNSSLRERLGIVKKNYPMASRIIKDTVEAGFIRQAGGTRKDATYVPFWA
ncbi:MAG: putative DNA binding domain-containing protein [Candidatus Aureabacteria bacterium]|nr:putative DNA binding domain-containing protein [Candidatus Auribacterota bacterium]